MLSDCQRYSIACAFSSLYSHLFFVTGFNGNYYCLILILDTDINAEGPYVSCWTTDRNTLNTDLRPIVERTGIFYYFSSVFVTSTIVST